MQKKLLATGIVATLLLTIIPSTYAFWGFGNRGDDQKSKNLEAQETFKNQKESVQKAFENQDYEAFVEASGKTKLSEEKFDEIVERHKEKEAQREKIQATLENGDYKAWKNLHQTQFENMFSEERFNLMIEMHTAMEAGDSAKIQELREKMHDEIGGGFGEMSRGKGSGGKKRGGKFGGGDCLSRE